MTFLELLNVEKRFGSTTAVQQFSLQVKRGEFITFLGPSGCGKTTILRMIAGFEQPSSGQIKVNDMDITPTPANKRNFGMVFQSYALFPNMTVAANIGFGLRVAHQPAALIQDRVSEMLKLIRMEEFGSRYPHQLSGGQQQRVALARALAIQPQVLLLDEPLSALDAKIRVSLRQEIRAIQRHLGITTIFVTHDQEEALSISDRIVVMNKGRIEQLGAPHDIYNAPQTRFVASFVGTLNVLTAQADGSSSVLIDGQKVNVGNSEAAAGKPVTVAIRPEALSLHEGAPNGNHLDGLVEDIGFLGSVVRVRVRLQDQTINVDTFNNPTLVLPEHGDRIKVRFSPDACTVLRED
ncbi:MAG: ABC transporter ATP-binding protein [Anaerolineae bacterium]|nr:ABC transporter ATP-binding protein [Anaerolineae bacterium]